MNRDSPPKSPQITLGGLLVLTFFVVLISMVIRFTGWVTIIVLILFAPTVIGAICGLVRWPTKYWPRRIMHWSLGGLSALVAIALVSGFVMIVASDPREIGPFTCVFVFLAFVIAAGWGVQYAVFSSFYD